MPYKDSEKEKEKEEKIHKMPQNGQSGKGKKKRTRKAPIVKREVFEAYAIWSSIPLALRRLKPQQLEGLGIDTGDELLSKLINIKTKTQFAKEFNIDRGNLPDWEKREDFQKRVEELNMKNNVLKYKKDIDFKFTRKTIQEADAARVKLWKQLYEGWKETTEQNVNFKQLEEIANTLKKLADDKETEEDN